MLQNIRDSLQAYANSKHRLNFACGQAGSPACKLEVRCAKDAAAAFALCVVMKVGLRVPAEPVADNAAALGSGRISEQ